jgi:hypothetical protein
MAAPELAGVPVLILREGASRSRGREAQRANIMAAKIVAESVRARENPMQSSQSFRETACLVLTSERRVPSCASHTQI